MWRIIKQIKLQRQKSMTKIGNTNDIFSRRGLKTLVVNVNKQAERQEDG